MLYRLTGDIDALDSLYLRLLIPLGAASVATLAAVITLAMIKVELGIAVLLAMALTSPEVKAFIEKKYNGAVLPAF